jgi:type III secretion system YscQ/HrcQ family protein
VRQKKDTVMTADALWIKKIAPSIFESLSLSDLGSIPTFPLQSFTEQLKQSLELSDLSIEIGKIDTLTADSYYSALGSKPCVISLEMTPLDGEFYFAMAIEDIKGLIQKMEGEEPSPLTLENESVVKGLYTFFIAEALHTIMGLKVYQNLSLKMIEKKNEALESYSIDLGITIKGTPFWARLLIPFPFYRSIHSHFTFIPPTLDSLENIPDVAIPLSIRTGSVTFSSTEFEEIIEGDFLILHNCFYNCTKEKGSFQMVIGNLPLFQVKKQKDGIKLLDYLYFYNEEKMDDDDDFELKEDFSDDSTDDFLSEELSEEELSEEEPFEEEEDEEEEEVGEKSSLLSPEKTNLSKVSITIHMEVARFTLSLEELKKLSPGAKLPISINPRQVHLVVSGKSIGMGEIISLGDTVGVKVTTLYT